MNSEDLIALNEEIAGMARAGLPLDQGLAAMAKEMGGGRLRQVTAALAEDLRAGRTLPEALERQTGRVPPFYAGLVEAGVRTGRISEVLATLTVYARSLANLRAIVVDALFYPAVVLVFAMVLFWFLCGFILPRFDVVFQEFGMNLPDFTKLVLAVSRHAPEVFGIPLLVIVVGAVAVKLATRYSARGRRLWARWVYAVPVVGTLVRSARLAAFTELLAIMVEYEVPLPEAFRLAGAASSDPIMAAGAQQVHHDLQQGLPLAEALHGRGLVPEWVSWMTGLGERRGALGASLRQVAEMYRRQVEVRAGLLRSVLPPFLIITTVGVLIAAFVFAVMLPLIKLLEGLSK